MMTTCVVCGAEFEAVRAARFCSDRCRKRAARGRPLDAAPAAPVAFLEGAVTAATRDALAAAGRTLTPMGQAALVLARRLDTPGLDTGSALASITRQLGATLAEALKGARGDTAPGRLADELAARRLSHR